MMHKSIWEGIRREWLQNHQLFNMMQRSLASKTPKINAFPFWVCKFLSTVSESPNEIESPDLPGWLKSPESPDNQNPSTTSPENDDFVIPSLASWVEAHSDHNKVVKHLLTEVESDDDVDKLSKILKKRYPSPDTVVQALDGCGVTASNGVVEHILKRFSNDWIPAFGVFIWAKTQTGYEHSPELYNMMVDILGKSEKFGLMWEVVDEMDKIGGLVTLVTVTKVMRRLARAGRYDDATEAFQRVEKFGVSQDIMTVSVLMDALVKEGSVEHAYKVFLEFKDSIPFNSSCFNILIHGFCKARKLDDARKIMDEMEKHGLKPDVVSYTSFIYAHCCNKDFRKVDDVMQEMQEKGCTPSTITYTIITHALGKAKQITEALELYEKMKQNGCVLDASYYSSLIFILSKAGRLKDANEIFEDMKKQGVNPDALTYNTMISSACAHSQEETALKLLQRMEEDSCKPNLETYAPLLKLFCRKQRMKVINVLLNHMFKNDVSIDLGTYALLVHGLCRSGNPEQACLFFEATVLRGMVPKDSTYKLLVEELEKKNMVREKEQIEKLMIQATEG